MQQTPVLLQYSIWETSQTQAMGGAHWYYLSPFQGSGWFSLRLALPVDFVLRPFRAWLILGFFYGEQCPPILSYALLGLNLISFAINSAWSFYLSPFQGLVNIRFLLRRGGLTGVFFFHFLASAGVFFLFGLLLCIFFFAFLLLFCMF